MSISTEFVEEIACFADDLPSELVVRLADSLYGCAVQDWSRIQAVVLRKIPQESIRERTRQFLHFWQTCQSTVTPQAVGLALRTASQVSTRHHAEQSLELVWTGPASPYIPLRRTDEALLQMIDGANSHLTIVSFVVYKISSIAQALTNAANRGVEIAVYLETPDSSQNKVDFDTIRAFGSDVVERLRIFVWAFEKRKRSLAGKHGSLHAKVAVADSKVMLISSANLTDYAMTLNMELGLLVQGGTLPGRVQKHFTSLTANGVFEEWKKH